MAITSCIIVSTAEAKNRLPELIRAVEGGEQVVIARKAGSTPFQKMDSLFRAVIAVPKEVIDKREKEWKRARKRKKTPKR